MLLKGFIREIEEYFGFVRGRAFALTVGDYRVYHLMDLGAWGPGFGLRDVETECENWTLKSKGLGFGAEAHQVGIDGTLVGS